jgi:hypothetical protein
MEDELFVDFEDTCQCEEIVEKKYSQEYDEQTTEFYKNMRVNKYNVINHDIFSYDINRAFQFEHMWDPYTGEIKEKDIFGPLCFDPDELIHFYYKRRLKLLWNESKDEAGGFYEGFYGDAVGSGENINIPGRGLHPELYLFRLPIDDCYLPKDSDLSIITMGPKLSQENIKHIDFLAETYHTKNYYNNHRKQRPTLQKIMELYNIAIDNRIDEKTNREAVSKLASM